MAVGLGQDEWESHPHGRKARRSRHVSPSSHDDVRTAGGEELAGGAHRTRGLACGDRGLDRIPAVQAAYPHIVDLVAGGGHELRLGALAGAGKAVLRALSAT